MKINRIQASRFALFLFGLMVMVPFSGWAQTSITDLAGLNAMTASGDYILEADINAAGYTGDITDFSGTLDGGAKADGTFYTISGLTKPLFNSIDGGTVKNIMLKDVAISIDGNAGAITKELKGTSDHVGAVYNCGILSGSVGGGTGNNDHVGGLVGDLGVSGDNSKCYARVINCFSYATITSGKYVAGIVGYNFFKSKASDIRTMVMNCMFYGDITGGTTVSPVYGGENINNLQSGLNTFNYYAYDKLKTKAISSGKYNCALAVEEKYLNRFEFYRLLLNSNKKLAAFYATGSVENAEQKMAKWVLETADRTIANPKPYPILKQQGYYPSIINPDIANAPDSTTVGPNEGGKLGRTLSVTILTKSQKTDGGQTWPTAAASDVQTTSLTLQRTDKDFDRFNFNYDKVQLPYYNDIGTGNYTENRVVTGWKITAITALAGDPYTADNYNYNKTFASNREYFDYPNYNFADRKSSNKDLYNISKRVFSQGAYFDVPYGVTSITIEPYWAKCAYISDPNYDVVYKNDYSGKQNVTQTGIQVTVGTTYFNGQELTTSDTDQRIETTVANALAYIKNNLGGYGSTVYDNAVVLVGNLHLDGVPSGGTDPFTMMSVDVDNDHEPDYSLIYHHKGRTGISPIRFDFLAIPGTAQAQKPNGASLICNFTIFKTKGWFECTNTAFFYTSQVEYENIDGITKVNAPLILQGGVIDQFVSTQSKAVNGSTIYIHVGGNVWINSFGMGTHSDGSQSTPHVPVSVTGGEYPGFYLTGTYNANAAVSDDNAECYISGGHFGELAGACLEQIGNNNTTNGNVRWQIYNADIDNFFGGGINDAKPVKGNITTEIFNSRVSTFCGGPKFGNMNTNKTVTTTAEGCTFDKFFGAGYGGNSYSKKKYTDETSYNFTNLQKYYYNPGSTTTHENERGKYYNGINTNSVNSQYGKKGPGVATDFDYEFFVWSTGLTGARFYIKFISFSLAQCNDVNSTLKRCTINGNFYGGGSLGKVTGTATSELEDCIVHGDAYGAGFSATLPTIQVRDAGFLQTGTNTYAIPNFNQSSGMFEPGTFSGTTDYTWTQVDSYPAEGGAGFDGTQVITTQSLSKDDLGSVHAVSLTLQGNTLIQGSVFGGGEESKVIENTFVHIKDKTKVSGSIYGGGNMGTVGGDTKVIVNGQ